MLLRTCLLLLAVPVAAGAQPTQARYAAYAAGLNVVNMDASFEVTGAAYSLRLDYQTAGTFGFFLRSHQQTTVQGQFGPGGKAVPSRFFSTGSLRGNPRVTQIDYQNGNPAVRQLVPANDTEREKVPVPLQQGTIDTLSAIAQLVHQVNQTGRCEGRATTFDGRRLSELTARTVSWDDLPPTRLSSFTGRALHCDFEGRQLGGFMLDEDRERLQRPQHGSAWFAALSPGGKLIPVRMSFHTRWFGDATMFLTGE